MNRASAGLENIVAKALHRAPPAESALLAWPVVDREQMEILSEVLQKWAHDQAVKGLPGGRRFFGPGSGKPADSDAWLRFAREAGRYRVAARHPLNPKLFAADLIGRMPA